MRASHPVIVIFTPIAVSLSSGRTRYKLTDVHSHKVKVWFAPEEDAYAHGRLILNHLEVFFLRSDRFPPRVGLPPR